MTTIESAGKVVTLTPEYLSVGLAESTVQALRDLINPKPIIKEAVDNLFEWADFPVIWIRDIVSVSLEAIPTTPGSEHLFKVLILARFRGGQRIYEIHLNPEDAKRLASEIESLIQKRF